MYSIVRDDFFDYCFYFIIISDSILQLLIKYRNIGKIKVVLFAICKYIHTYYIISVTLNTAVFQGHKNAPVAFAQC